MRLLVNCPSGESRLLQVDDNTTVLELKHLLFEKEGIPVHQQVLCFAGQHLKDHLPLCDHGLEHYTLSDEVILYLSKKLANPKRIFLTSRSKPTQKLAELVEGDMPVGAVMALLESRALATPFASNAPIFAKRQDGHTIPMTVDPSEPIDAFEKRVAKGEGVAPESLTFNQAQDGAMHLTVHPSAATSSDTYPVYKRGVTPQPAIMKKDEGQPLPELVKELCVLPCRDPNAAGPFREAGQA